jgi:hypothetical protein
VLVPSSSGTVAERSFSSGTRFFIDALLPRAGLGFNAILAGWLISLSLYFELVRSLSSSLFLCFVNVVHARVLPSELCAAFCRVGSWLFFWASPLSSSSFFLVTSRVLVAWILRADHVR